MVCYKIVTHGAKIQYLSGVSSIDPFDQAAEDAWGLMGNTRYQQTVLADELSVRHRGPITEPDQVTNSMDLARYLAEMDARRPSLGGRSNGWRLLEGVPITGLMHINDEITYSVRRARLRIRSHLQTYPKSMVSSQQFMKHDYVHSPSTLSKAQQDKARRIRKIERLRQLYLNGESGKSSAVSSAPHGLEGDDDEFSILYEWSTALDMDSYEF
jgi:hypothetical protein